MPWLQLTSNYAVFICPFCKYTHINKNPTGEICLENMIIDKTIDDKTISKEILKLATQNGIKLKQR